MPAISLNPPQGTLRTVLMIPVAALSLLLLAVCTWSIATSWRQYSGASETQEFDRAANKFIAGLYEVLMERLATNNGLQAPAPAGADVIGEIEKRRAAVKENFDSGLRMLEAMDFPNKATLMQELRRTLDLANAARSKADAALKLPRDQRDDTLLKTFIPVVTDSVNAALNLWFSALHSSAKSDPFLARLASIKEIGFRLRDTAGTERSHIAQAISAKAAIPADRLVAIAGIQARVDILFRQLDNLVLDARMPAEFQQAIAGAKDGYFKGFRLAADEMRKASESGADYKMDAREWVTVSDRYLGTLLNVLYAASRVSESHTAALKSSAFMGLAILIGVLVASLLIAVASGVMIVRRVSRPMTALTSAVGRLAGGDLDVAIAQTERSDEIGALARSVQVFKDNAIALKDAEATAASQRQASDEDRARNERARAAAAKEVEAVVGALGKGLEQLAKGDLTYRLTGDIAPEYKKVQDDFNAAMNQLQETIHAITASSREVSSASSEISSSTTDLSQRTEEQAASLEKTSASMEEISVTVKKNAESAQRANKVTAGTRDVADRGGAVVAQAVQAMSRIADSSTKISDIIGVIDEIARQTNLLALNAAVEAARAGEAGRGFAVVASEVRSLAQRSSQAAKDIKDLIVNSAGQVKDGVKLVNRAGTSLQEIVESIKQVAEIVSDIASASGEQSTGLDHVNRALAQMDEATQQNSALVEQNAATAKMLEQQSHAMSEQVGFFRADREATPQRSPAGRPCTLVA